MHHSAIGLMPPLLLLPPRFHVRHHVFCSHAKRLHYFDLLINNPAGVFNPPKPAQSTAPAYTASTAAAFSGGT
jgi:hypothetical protein